LQVPLEITGHHVSVSKRAETLIAKKAKKLERFYDRLTSCRVVIDGPEGQRKNGLPFRVRIHLGVPGSEITIDRQQQEDLTAAIHAAFDAATRKLQDYARTRRGEVKQRAVEGP
jgi:ribosomal subunit interface protein